MPNDETDLIVCLFVQEVPEVAGGIVEIKGVARRPGMRSKLALHSRDPQVDCIGVCVGARGCRIKRIVDQLDAERIDLFRWNDSPEQLIRNALMPAAIEQVVLHPATHRATVVVKEDQRALALGPGGVNRDLASRLCGWEIEVVAS
jgi:N utilization substance protein A